MVDKQHSSITDPNIHEPKGTASANEGDVYVADGAGSGAWTAKEPYKVVTQLSDLPTPVSNVITLESGITYLVHGTISLGVNRIETNGATAIVGLDVRAAIINYTGTGNMFSGNNTGFRLDHLGIECPNGTVFSYTGSGSASTDEYVIDWCTFVGCNDLGSLENARFLFMNRCFVFNCVNGLTISGSDNARLQVLDTNFINTTNTALDLGTSVSNDIIISRCIFQVPAGGIGIDGAASDANVNNTAKLTGCNFSDSGDHINNIDREDIKWTMLGNSSIDTPDSSVLDTQLGADMNIVKTTGAAATTISGGSGDAGNPIKVAGTWTNTVSDEFTFNSNGRLTYNGLETIEFHVNFFFRCQVSAGTNQDVIFYLAKNGTVLDFTATGTRIDSGDFKNQGKSNLVNLSTNDYIEMFCENTTSTNNITVDYASINAVKV